MHIHIHAQTHILLTGWLAGWRELGNGINFTQKHQWPKWYYVASSTCAGFEVQRMW